MLVPTVALCPLPPAMLIPAGCPAVPVALKRIGEPVSPVELAVNEFAPGTAPSVQLPIAAMPDASVVADAPVTEPLPVATANVTDTFATALPCASVTITDGGVVTDVPAVAD